MYDSSLKAKWDYENSIAYAEEKAEERGIEKGIEKGIEQGIEKNTRETALKMIKSGLVTNPDHTEPPFRSKVSHQSAQTEPPEKGGQNGRFRTK